jgi:predicted NUDIX family NTP pyrophosphohydrolase
LKPADRKTRLISAGVLVWRRRPELDFLLGHPGGPYWMKKDNGAWTIPKGLVEQGHDLEATAQREFFEETGLKISGDLIALAPVKSTGGKILYALAIQADLDLSGFVSNPFTIEWPPRSGRMAEFPEIDRIGYFSYADALIKVTGYQRPLLEETRRRFGQ